MYCLTQELRHSQVIAPPWLDRVSGIVQYLGLVKQYVERQVPSSIIWSAGPLFDRLVGGRAQVARWPRVGNPPAPAFIVEGYSDGPSQLRTYWPESDMVAFVALFQVRAEARLIDHLVHQRFLHRYVPTLDERTREFDSLATAKRMDLGPTTDPACALLDTPAGNPARRKRP
jgi:hypothetical protein